MFNLQPVLKPVNGKKELLLELYRNPQSKFLLLHPKFEFLFRNDPASILMTFIFGIFYLIVLFVKFIFKFTWSFCTKSFDLIVCFLNFLRENNGQQIN